MQVEKNMILDLVENVQKMNSTLIKQQNKFKEIENSLKEFAICVTKMSSENSEQSQESVASKVTAKLDSCMDALNLSEGVPHFNELEIDEEIHQKLKMTQTEIKKLDDIMKKNTEHMEALSGIITELGKKLDETRVAKLQDSLKILINKMNM